jgi:hypothetical protein
MKQPFCCYSSLDPTDWKREKWAFEISSIRKVATCSASNLCDGVIFPILVSDFRSKNVFLKQDSDIVF